MPKILILPWFQEEDRGDGGIRRVVEAQRRWLPTMGWTLVDTVADADLVATHAALTAEVPATKPLVHHNHGLYWHGYEWERWALKMNRDVIKSMRRADVVTAPSKWVAHAIARGAWIDAPVLYHGIEPDEWDPPAEPGRYVLWNKTRIDAVCDPTPVGELAKRVPDVDFATTVAWNLPDLKNLHDLGVSTYSRARDIIRLAGVYLCTTRETFGIGTLEAMAAGVPVLGWDWGGQAEIVRHRETGWLARPDDYDGLVEGLRYCIEHRDALGAAARETVLSDFTWEKAIARYNTLYRGLLDRTASPRVSVVIPAYNMERYLEEAVSSVVSQGLDYDEYEIIIVDDASTDTTPAIADRLATEQQISVIHNPKNLYLAEALNVGIAASRGRYVVPLDADNMLERGALALLSRELDRDRDIDIAYGAMSVIEPDGTEWTASWPGQFQFRGQLVHRNQITSTSMYRRRAWERVGGYRRRCRTAEDADFWCRATSLGANAKRVTDAVVLRYRNRPDSMSHVVEDWPWHEWYPWGRKADLTPWIAPVDDERDDPVIPVHENAIVSVVIPVGPGHERLVLDALDSLQAQTFRWWEAIVVNDTGAVLPWVHPWARVVTTVDGSKGAGAARNAGMSVARGRLFLFLDADDYLQPKALELMVETYTRTGGFVYSDWFHQETGEAKPAPEWDGCESVLRQLPWSVTCLYPMQAWIDTGGFDTTLTAWEDWDFAIRVVRAGYCGTRVATPLFHYRYNSGSRRESGFADRDELKQEILKRWGKYITKEIEMPCGCGGGGGLPSLPALDLAAPSAVAGIATETGKEMVMLEFTEEVAAPVSWTGKVTGTRYKFGSDSGHRVRFVYADDAPGLLTHDSFRVYNELDGSAQLMASGPPR